MKDDKIIINYLELKMITLEFSYLLQNLNFKIFGQLFQFLRFSINSSEISMKVTCDPHQKEQAEEKQQIFDHRFCNI